MFDVSEGVFRLEISWKDLSRSYNKNVDIIKFIQMIFLSFLFLVEGGWFLLKSIEA